MDNDHTIKPIILSLGKDTVWYIPSLMIPTVFGFISLMIYTRVFSPGEYGDYSLTMATVQIIGVFSYSWINISCLRFFSAYKNSDNLKEYYSTSFFILIALLLSTSAVLAILSLLSLLPDSIAGYLFLAIGLIFSISFFETLLTTLRAERNAKDYSFFRGISTVSCLALSLILIYVFNFRISAILLGIVIVNASLSILIIFKYNLIRYVGFTHTSKKTMMDFANYGIPLIVTLLFSWILSISDRYIIEFFRGSSEVGIYSAVYQLGSYPILLFPSLIGMAAYPIIIDTWEKNGEEITKDLIYRINKYYLLFAIPALVGIFVLSRELTNILGPSYSAGYAVIPWICFGGLLFGLSDYVTKGLELKKNTRVLAMIVIIAGVSNIVLNLLLVPKLGFYGAGVASCLAYVIYFLASVVISRRYMKWVAPVNSIKNIVIGSMVMGASLLAVKAYIGESLFDLIFLIVFGSIIYLISIILIGEIKDEMAFIKKYQLSLIKHN